MPKFYTPPREDDRHSIGTVAHWIRQWDGGSDSSSKYISCADELQWSLDEAKKITWLHRAKRVAQQNKACWLFCPELFFFCPGLCTSATEAQDLGVLPHDDSLSSFTLLHNRSGPSDIFSADVECIDNTDEIMMRRLERRPSKALVLVDFHCGSADHDTPQNEACQSVPSQNFTLVAPFCPYSLC